MTCAFKKNLYAIYCISENYDVYYLLAILNSKLFSFIHVKANVSVQRDDFPSFSLDDFRKFLIPKLTKEEQMPLAEKVKLLMNLNKEFTQKVTEVKKRIKNNFEIDKLGSKLDKFYHFTFNDFLNQIRRRSKVKLSVRNEEELENYFTDSTREINKLVQDIKNIDRKIDEIVFSLYKLSESEIENVVGFFQDKTA